MPFPALSVLRCPVCESPWDLGDSGDRSLLCTQGHRFDAARQGYVNFLTGRGTRYLPDTADMVAARERFLGAGHYAPIAEALAGAAAEGLTADAGGGGLPRGASARRHAVLDAGAGTGYYLAALLGRAPEVDAVALDLSKHALQRAARLPGTAAIVWDLWRTLPLHDGSVDVVLDVFAPRNFPEFARVLRPGGLLCAVTPQPGHLAELRGILPMLDVPAGKADALAKAAGPQFEAVSVRPLDVALELTRDSAADLAFMGPAGHHATREDVLASLPEGPLAVRAAVELSVLRRR